MIRPRPGSFSLRFRLVASAVVIEIIMLSILVWNSMRLTENYLLNQSQFRINEVVPLLKASLAGPLLEEDIARIKEIVEQVVSEQGLRFIEVKNSLGQTLVTVGQRAALSSQPTSPAAGSPADEAVPEQLQIPVSLENHPLGSLQIEVDTHFLASALAHVRREGLGIALIEILLSIMLLTAVGLALTKQLYSLTGAAEKIAAGDFSTRVEVTSNDEVGALQEGFNKMFEVMAHREAERDSAETALQEREQRYRTLIESAKTLPWEVDVRTMRFTYVGPQAEDMLGYPLDKWYEEGFWAGHIHPADRQRVVAYSAEQTQLSQDHELEYRLTTRDGEESWIRNIVNVITDEQGVARLSGFMFDITPRKQAELELDRYRSHLEELVDERTERLSAAMEEADRANQLKSEFLSRMSHELRTPLNAILGFGQLLAEDDLNTRQKEFVQEISQASEHLLNLINEVLNLTRIETGNIQPVIENVNLSKLIQEVLALHKPLAQQRGIKIDNYVCDKDIFVRADAFRLKDVLINLVSNAVKYNKAHGHVTVNSTEPQSGIVRIQVIDTGIGLTPEQQQNLFEPFNRLGQEYSDIEGTGIGLTITRHLVDMMGARMGLESQPGEGSTFWVECPLAGASPHEVEPNSESGGSSASGAHTLTNAMVLYIEDNPANLRLVEKVIQRHTNIQVLSAPNAEMGLELAKHYRPDLILMDLNLPGMDGYEALSRLRNNELTRDIPVIALSAAAMTRDIERGKLAGFKRYLTKPIKIDELREVLAAELEGKAIKDAAT